MKVYTIIGIILTIVGVFFLIQLSLPSPAEGPSDVDWVHEAAPILTLVFLPMGLIFTAVGLLVGRLTGNQSRLIAKGPPGHATIVSAAGRPNTLSAMGSTIGAPDTPAAASSEIPSLTTIELGELFAQMAQGGVVFSPVAIAGQTSGVTIITGGDAYQAQLAALRGPGSSGRALIRSVQDLGIAIQGQKVENIKLEVTLDGGSRYTVQHVAFVPASAVPRATAGTNVMVHVDRTNPQNVAIDWAAG